MNTAISSTGFEDYSFPNRASSPSLKPIPKSDDLDDDIHLFSVLDRMDYLPVSARLPEKRHPVLDVDSMVVGASLLRRIDQELKNDECDPRTVLNFCRGMARNSLEFEDAYIAARIRSFAKHQRVVTDPFLGTPSSAANPPQDSSTSTQKWYPVIPPHPMAVNHLGHLMSHFGIWVIALLATQVWAAWRISAVADTYLEGGRPFYFTIVVFLVLALNSTVWFRRRGRLCDAFLVPGAMLFLAALLPLLTLHLREVLLAMR